MEIQYSVILAYVIGIILVFVIGRLFLMPLKLALKLFYNGLLGGIVLAAINLVGGMFEFHISLNVVSALIVGTLGVPGVLLLILLKLIFRV